MLRFDARNLIYGKLIVPGAGFAPVELMPLDPSLEDVFIAAIAQEELRGKRIAA